MESAVSPKCSSKSDLWFKKIRSCTPSLYNLHWLPVKQRIIFKILLLMYKARSGEVPKYLKDLLLPYSAHHKGLTVQLRSPDDPTLLDTPSTPSGNNSGSLVGLVVSKSHACYLLEGAGWDWVRILLGLNFSGSACGISGHA